MILVRVRDDDPRNTRPLLFEERDIREDEIDARQIGMGEGDAEIDHEPRAVMLTAETVEREVHAYLADAAKWQEDQFVLVTLRHYALTVATAPKCTSPA